MDIKEHEEKQTTNNTARAIKSFIFECKKRWRWFAASICFCLTAAILFLIIVTPQYERSATILIKDESSSGGMLSALAAGASGILSGMGLNISSNVNNEMEILNSPKLMSEVVSRLELDMRYKQTSFFMSKELWDETLPIKVSLPDAKETDLIDVRIELRKDGSFTLKKMKKNKDSYDDEISGNIGKMIKTPAGKLVVTKTATYDNCFGDDNVLTIDIRKNRKFEQTESCLKQLSVDLANDLASVISLSYRDMSGKRAEQVLNTLLTVFKEERDLDKLSESEASTRFINERLDDIERELHGLDSDIAQFKGKNMIPDYEQTAKMYMENVALTYEAQVKVNNQLYMMEQMRDYVKRNQSKNEVLPANMLPDNENVAIQISEYNKLQLKRNSMAENSNENNPLVKDLDRQLESLRTALLKSLDNGVIQLQAQQKGINREDHKLKQQISVAPEKMTKILPAERQHKIIETLYIYLLEKREENNISKAFSGQNMRIVSPPMGRHRAVFPKKITTLIFAVLLGFLLPIIGLYLRQNIKLMTKEI